MKLSFIKRGHVAIIALLTSFFAQAQDEFSRDVTYLSGKDNFVTVQVTAQAMDKKNVEAMACKSVLDTYLFSGIEGVGTGMPKLDAGAANLHRDYFRTLYARKYTVFANMPVKVVKPKKNMAGVFEGTYNVTFKQAAFDRDLCTNNIISCGVEPVQLPTIIVVPFRKDGESYRTILDNDPNIRIAISKVQTAFRKAGYTTIDFIAKLESAERHNNFTQDNADSFATQLIRNSGSDIYVSVDCSFVENYRSNHVSLALKAYYSATGNITASATSSYDGKLPFDRCCVGAIHRVMTDFIKQIKWPPTKIESRLAVGIDSESMLTLESVIGNQGATVAEEIRAWVKKNAKSFHQQGLTDTEVIFDTIILPDDCDSTDFAIKLAQHLRKQGVSAKYTIDGLSIYITVSD